MEDDQNLREALADNLREEGYQVATAATVAQAWEAAAAGAPEVVVLDLMLPDGDGAALCRRLRAAGHPARVLMLTARSLEDDVVKGFEVGADDYLTKPYRLRELLARVAALARRTSAAPPPPTWALGPFTVDAAARTVTGPDGEVELTRKELDLLLCFLAAGERVLTRDHLLDQVWGPEVVVDAHTVDNFVGSLKKKLKAGADAFELKTVRGVGFRLARRAGSRR